MSPASRTAVPRHVVLAVAMVAFVGLAALVASVDALRHPPAIEPAPVPDDDGDPRQAITCPEHPPSDSEPVTSDELYECPAVFDGATVRFRGEVVGALLERADGAWTQLNDDAYAGDLGPLPAHRDFRGGNAGVGVHLAADLADQITYIGGPHARGDVLTVTGVFHRVDAHSGEVAVIRAHEGDVSQPGEPISHRALPDRRTVGILVALAVAALFAGEQVVRSRRRRFNRAPGWLRP